MCQALTTTQLCAAGPQELELEQKQFCLHKADEKIDSLTLELEQSAWTQADQYSKLTRQLEYTRRVGSSVACEVPI